MKAIEPGHFYELANLEGGTQQLQFIHKEKQEDGTFKTVTDGTTNEEVFDVLIDRMNFLQGLLPCDENVGIIEHLEAAHALVYQRTAAREAAGVKGTANAIPANTSNEQKADEEKPADTAVNGDEEVEVTQQDLDNNPALAQRGIEVGHTVKRSELSA